MARMRCDRCKLTDFNEVLILREKKFTNRGKDIRKYHRVCLKCARKITTQGLYDLGESWRGVFNYITKRVK